MSRHMTITSPSNPKWGSSPDTIKIQFRNFIKLRINSFIELLKLPASCNININNITQ